MNALQELLDSAAIGEAATHENLTVFPITSSARAKVGYSTLDEAAEKGSVQVLETSEAGSVPKLKVVNKSQERVLLVDGEELAGAKQNRILNTSVLVAARSEIEIPVSCVEQGRWSYRSRAFSPRHYSPSSLRGLKTSSVLGSLRHAREHGSDQAAIWAEIRRKHDAMMVSSDTDDLWDAYADHGGDIDAYVDAFEPPGDAVGLAAAIEGRVVGLDIFSSPHTLKRLWRKLLQGYAIDAVERRVVSRATGKEEGEGPESTAADVKAFIKRASSAKHEDFAAVGLGEEVRFEGEGMVGSALLFEEEVIHFELFDRPEARPGAST